MENFLQIEIDFSDAVKHEGLSSLAVISQNTYYQVKSVAGAQLNLKIRNAYPATFCDVNVDSVTMGYGARTPSADDEFLHVQLNSDSLRITRDVFATLPLYYSFVDGLFVAGNNFSWVVTKTPKRTRNIAHIIETLQPNPDQHTTLWNEIHILDERQQLLITQQAAQVIQPPARVRNTEQHYNPEQFATVFRDVLDRFSDTRLHSQNFGFEVSGGIDSSTLPLYLKCTAKAHNRPLGSMVFPGEFMTSQLEKLQDITDHAAFKVIKTNIAAETDYPLARFADNDADFYNFDEIYTEALIKLADAFQKEGVEVVATGIGGDEIFENIASAEEELLYGSGERHRRQNNTLAPFLTDQYRQDYIEAVMDTPPYPLPAFGVSVYGAQLARNNVYINRGIWPVSPFVHPALYEFSQGLPAHFRANKNILRAFYQANKWPPSIYSPTQNENFSSFFTAATSSANFIRLAQRHLQTSQLQSTGYIETNKLQNYLNAVISGETTDYQWLFNVFTWLTLEINLQAA